MYFTGKLEKSSTSTEMFDDKTIEKCRYTANSINNCLFTNEFLNRYEKTKYDTQRHHISTEEIRIDDTCTHESEPVCNIGLRNYSISVLLKNPHCSWHSLNELNVMRLIGNREYGAGLESVFLYVGNTRSASNVIANISGISVSANAAKFYDCHRFRGRQQSRVHEVVTENKTYTVFKQDSFSALSYRTIPAANYIPDKFAIARGQGNVVDTAIPVTFLKTDLLCHLESGLYFAKHEYNGDMTVGSITFSLMEIETNTVHSVRQSDTDVPLCKLKPLTMVEGTDNSIIVVCSVEDDNSKLLMIRTDQEGPEAIEILDVDYSLSDLRVYKESEDDDENELLDTNITDASVTASTHTEATTEKSQTPTVTESNFVTTIAGETKAKISEFTLGNIAEATLVDLEIDIDGNIMFLLERKNGNSFCVCTKYIMP